MNGETALNLSKKPLFAQAHPFVEIVPSLFCVCAQVIAKHQIPFEQRRIFQNCINFYNSSTRNMEANRPPTFRTLHNAMSPSSTRFCRTGRFYIRPCAMCKAIGSQIGGEVPRNNKGRFVQPSTAVLFFCGGGDPTL